MSQLDYGISTVKNDHIRENAYALFPSTSYVACPPSDFVFYLCNMINAFNVNARMGQPHLALNSKYRWKRTGAEMKVWEWERVVICSPNNSLNLRHNGHPAIKEHRRTHNAAGWKNLRRTFLCLTGVETTLS